MKGGEQTNNAPEIGRRDFKHTNVEVMGTRVKMLDTSGNTCSFHTQRGVDVINGSSIGVSRMYNTNAQSLDILHDACEHER